MTKRTVALDRVALATAEALLDHRVSERELERMTGVSRRSIHKLVRGGRVRADLVMRIGSALLVLELFSPPVPTTDVVDELAARLAEATA